MSRSRFSRKSWWICGIIGFLIGLGIASDDPEKTGMWIVTGISNGIIWGWVLGLIFDYFSNIFKPNTAVQHKIPLNQKSTNVNRTYYGSVVCDCFKNGNTTEPPFKEYVRFDEEGLYLDPPFGLTQVEKDLYNKKIAEFNVWKNSACVHEDMELAFEYLADNYKLDKLKSIINEYGSSINFPILTGFLPGNTNDILPSDLSSGLFDELIVLENTMFYTPKIRLYEIKQNLRVVSIDISENFHLLSENTKYAIGIDKEGFYIHEKTGITYDIRLKRFQSKHFDQKRSSNDKYVFTDIKSGISFECELYIYLENHLFSSTYEFQVRIEKATIGSELDHIINPLKTLAEAAIISRNPIHWKVI